VIQDTATDPAQWANNKIIQTLDIKAPE
jgi:hypothetical protein